jgi:hypothetical protein
MRNILGQGSSHQCFGGKIIMVATKIDSFWLGLMIGFLIGVAFVFWCLVLGGI